MKRVGRKLIWQVRVGLMWGFEVGGQEYEGRRGRGDEVGMRERVVRGEF